MTLKFLLEGTESKFQIRRIDLPENSKERKHFQKAFTFENIQKAGETPSFVDLKTRPIVCYLSTESLKPLTLFFNSISADSQKNTEVVITSSEGSDTLPVKDYETLMDCIHSRTSKEEEVVRHESPRIDANFSSIRVIVNDPNSNYINKRQLSIGCNNMHFSIKQATALDILTPRGTNPQGCYHKKYLQIETIDILENFDGCIKPIQILQTQLMAHIYDCYYKNHPLYIDQKIHVLIPFVNVNIDDGAVLLLEVIKVLTAKDTTPTVTKVEPHNTAKDVDMGKSQSRFCFENIFLI